MKGLYILELFKTRQSFALIQIKEYFSKWSFNVKQIVIAQTAMDHIMEVNHKHVKARVQTGL